MDKIQRGSMAEAIYDSDLFKDAVRDVRDKTLQMFADSDLDDDNARLVSRIRLDLLESVVGELRHHLQHGQAARSQLQKFKDILAKAKDRMK